MPKSMEGVMHEFKHHELHSGGSGKVVKSRAQAIAIGLSEQRERRAKNSPHPHQSHHGPKSGHRIGHRP